jgi:hypothetical protein
MSISDSTATFASSLPLNIGVGDALQYDKDGDGDRDGIVFIHGRISDTQYVVKTATGTTPSDRSSDDDWDIFRAYDHLEDAEAGTGWENSGLDDNVEDFETHTNGRNLVANNEIWNIACYGETGSDTYYVTVDGWNTDADNYLRIYTPYLSSEVGESQRHDGKWNAGKYRMVIQEDSSCISVYDVNVRIEGLQVHLDTNTIIMTRAAIWVHGENAAVHDIRISDCIIRGNTSLNSGAGLYYIGINTYDSGNTWASGSNVYIWNNIIYDFVNLNASAYGEGIDVDRNNTDYYVYNNTVYNCKNGCVAWNGNVYAQNNIAQNCEDGYYDTGGYFDSSSDFNISDVSGDASAINDTFTAGYATTTFVDEINDDFHLASTDSVAIDTGAALSSEYAYDIDGDTRPWGAKWDIGADECTGEYIGTPANLVFIDVNYSSVTVAWDLLNDATGYTLVASTESASPPVDIWSSSTTISVTCTTATVSGLDEDTTYYFFVQAHGLGLSGSYSDYISTTTNLGVYAVQIYRSVGPTNMTALATDTYGNMWISNSTASFAGSLPDNIGVGDALQYDKDGDGARDGIKDIGYPVCCEDGYRHDSFRQVF